jgi:arylsulfatase A-like enzyme
VLTDFTACSDWTVASTACLLTGATNLDLAPTRGMVPILLQDVLTDIPKGEAMLPTWLGEVGYGSLLVTSNGYFGAAHGNAQGYDHIVQAGQVRVPAVWDATLQRIDPAEGGTPMASPWFLHMHFFEPHRPYTPPEEYIVGLEDLPPIAYDLSTVAGQEAADRDMSAQPPILTEAEVDAIHHSMRLRYAGEVRLLDAGLREVWAGLEERGLLDDTLVVFWTDHGEELWEHGPPGHGYLLHRGENDAAAMFWAKNIVPGTWDGPTQSIDIAPTLLAHYGIERPASMTGLPIGTAPADRPRFALADGYMGPVQSVRRGSSLLQLRWARGREGENLEHYDLASDPTEERDLFDPTAPSDEVRALWELLRPQVEAAVPWIAEDPRGWEVDWPRGL